MFLFCSLLATISATADFVAYAVAVALYFDLYFIALGERFFAVRLRRLPPPLRSLFLRFDYIKHNI